MKFYSFIILLLILGINYGCSNNDSTGPVIIKEVIIDNVEEVYGRWKIHSISTGGAFIDVNGDGVESNDMVDELPNCFLDNIITLESNLIYKISDESEICNSADYNFSSGEFEYRANNPTFPAIVLNPDGGSVSDRLIWSNFKKVTDSRFTNNVLLHFETNATGIALLEGGLGMNIISLDVYLISE